ncbi:RNA polymerase sigma factor [Streptomyces sp. NPDC001568]|uniref:RNA polymerase sigma factor n=1 Tax=Streptomyces sp. NPDC001568 TaxID=3364588 RepID=UPI0036B025B3
MVEPAVGDGLGGEAATLSGDVAQRVLAAHREFFGSEPYAVQRAFPKLSWPSCQEAVHEAYLQVGRRAAAGKLGPRTDVMAYLRRAARNCAIDQIRRQQREGRRVIVLDEALLDAVRAPRHQQLVVEPAARTQEDRRVLRDLVIPAIRSMPESRRRQVVDLQSKGLSDPDIAVRLGIPLDRLYKDRSAAVAALRRTLAGHIRVGLKMKKEHGRKDR